MISMSLFFDKGDSIIKSSSVKLAAKNKRVAVFFSFKSYLKDYSRTAVFRVIRD